MPAPKSPLDKPSSHRRPGVPHRSSSDKSATLTSTSSKLSAKNDRPLTKIKDTLGEPSSAKAASTSERPVKEAKQLSGRLREETDARGERDTSPPSTSRQTSDRTPEPSPGLGHGENPADEVERLKAAMIAQIHMSQSRERLKKRLGENGGRDSSPLRSSGSKARVSPIHEENAGSPSLEAAFSSPVASARALSTESGNTIRGAHTPASQSVLTPSYPFPSMKTPRHSYVGHRPFTALSPTVAPRMSGSQGQSKDQSLSSPFTPTSGPYFQASGTQQTVEDPNFPIPNLYELSLALTSEPGLDPWWATVSQVMAEVYKAHRVTLSVPADSTDIENVPWGQKATFSLDEDDGLSLNYLPRGSSLHLGSADSNPSLSSLPSLQSHESTPAALRVRPNLASRHSFTAYEETKRGPLPDTDHSTRALPLRPSALVRAKSHLNAHPDQSPRSTTLQHAQLHLESLQGHLDIEHDERATAASWEDAESVPREVRGRVFPVMQALDYEADPLIDSSGVLRVIERGKLVALSRDYPYNDDPSYDKAEVGKPLQHDAASKGSSEKTEKMRPSLASRMSSHVSSKSSRRYNRGESTSGKGKSLPYARLSGEESPPTPRYEEHEQAPPSPWAQSPAPSPAVRVETTENPFFVSSSVVEDSFNPEQATEDYSMAYTVEAIGNDRSWTVLHVPLYHPLLSRPVQSFRLDAAAIESKTARRKDSGAPMGVLDSAKVELDKPRRVPIAIISVLSPVIPYVSNLRHSLEQFAPHLATTFSLCRSFSNLETEIAGLSRKRPHSSGFGILTSGPPGEAYPALSSDDTPYRSSAGSMTSPSEYSGISRSAHASPAVTPGWDSSSFGLSSTKRAAGSPGQVNAEGYFSARLKPSLGASEPGSAASTSRGRRPSKDPSVAESNHHQATAQEESQGQHVADTQQGDRMMQKMDSGDLHQPSTSASRRGRRRSQQAKAESAASRDASPSRCDRDASSTSSRQSAQAPIPQPKKSEDRSHTLLHSYGAQFGATFQSLPTTSAPSKKVTIQQTPSQTSLIAVDMPPPSDRLKGLIIDSLPAHVFVALPQTGEIVWVNNRYLTYRGQTVSDLHEDPWSSLHPDEKDAYLKAWGHAVRTGQQFSIQVRIRRFDGNYRWFYTRAVGSRDSRGVIVQWYGSHMDIHDQHIAEVKAARQEEIEASEAKHRQLANLIPQIIFAATEDEGVTFANEQWLSYTGQEFDDSLGLRFMNFIHPDDLARCHFPTENSRSPKLSKEGAREGSFNESQKSESSQSSENSISSQAPSQTTIRGVPPLSSRQSSSSSTSGPTAELSELAERGIIKVSVDTNGRQSYTTEVRIKNKLGEYRWHLVRCVEVDNISLGNRDGSWFGACTDINDQKLLESNLKEAMEIKSKFLSNMSHEIRTPLIGIAGMIGFLQDTELTEEQADFCNTCRASCDNLMNIINDILDLSKVDAGMMHMIPVWFHTRALLEEVNEIVSTTAITKAVELNYLVDKNVPPLIKADMARVRQILLNVVGNAVKFTAKGEIFTRCKLHLQHDLVGGESPAPDLSDSIMLEFTTIDTGKGFTPEEGARMFKAFSQVDGSSTRQQGGTGLGLVISRQLAGLHGGTLNGSAVPGRGATFTLTVQVGVPTEDDHPDEREVRQPLDTPLDATTPDDNSLLKTMKQAAISPVLASTFLPSPNSRSPALETDHFSPAVASSGSSDAPSLKSMQSAHSLARSSASSIAFTEPFNQAARAMGHGPADMKLALPERKSNPSHDSHKLVLSASQRPQGAPRNESANSLDAKSFRPPMYSILIVCQHSYSCEAIAHHIEMTLPRDIPHQITALQRVEDVEGLIRTEDPVIFSHIVLNLPQPDDTINFIDMLQQSPKMSQTIIVILSDPMRRQSIISTGAGRTYDELMAEDRIRYIYKPVKPSRFALIFDPEQERESSTDRTRSNAQQSVARQKKSYATARDRLGNKGYRILLVEDNMINQKVLLKHVKQLGVETDLAVDGQDCVEKVFSHDPGYYALIVCDLQMPRKDGYETCRDIRKWEKKNHVPSMPMLALSANVIDEAGRLCSAAGFDAFVTKPVDFHDLSVAIGDLLDPAGKSGAAPANVFVLS